MSLPQTVQVLAFLALIATSSAREHQIPAHADLLASAVDWRLEGILLRPAVREPSRLQVAANRTLGVEQGQAPPPSLGCKVGQYYDASRPPYIVDTPKLPIFSPADAGRYPRQPRRQVRPPPFRANFATCPLLDRSVKSAPFNAKGDGTTDDSKAIQTAARSNIQRIYFPPGQYRIAKSIVIDKPMYFGDSAQLKVDKGITVTISQPPQKWSQNSPLFAGQGKIKLIGSVNEIYPAWFKTSTSTSQESDSAALQQAVDSCAGSCTLILTGSYYLSKPLILHPRVGVASSNGQLVAHGSNEQGVVLTPGTYTLPLQFGVLWRFKDFAIKFQGGVDGAEVQVSSLLECGDGIVFAPSEGIRGTINNVFVTHITAMAAVQNAVNFRAESAKNSIVNCVVRTNFLVNPGSANPMQQSAALAIKGTAAPVLLGTSVVFQAIDALEYMAKKTFSMVKNSVDQFVSNVFFSVEVGGFGFPDDSTGRIVSGKFLNLLAILNNLNAPLQAQLLEISGKGNRVVLPAANGFYGSELLLSSARIPGQTPIFLAQVALVNAPILGSLYPGEERTFYFYSALASCVQGRLSCMPFRASNPGLVCSSITNVGSRGEIAITIKNTACTPTPSWLTAHRFGLQVGP